jgi:hypothetical protein
VNRELSMVNGESSEPRFGEINRIKKIANVLTGADIHVGGKSYKDCPFLHGKDKRMRLKTNSNKQPKIRPMLNRLSICTRVRRKNDE